jgi:HAD superfamily hydrolase (TIGR01549 family)
MRCWYRAIFFDLDGTLIEEGAGVPEARAAVAQALREQGHGVTDQRYSAAASAVIDDLLASNGGVWPAVFSRNAAITATLERLSLPTTSVGDLSERHRQVRLKHLTLISGAVKAVEQAGDQHRVGLITNGPSLEQREKLRRSGLESRFESMTISGEVGVAKPEPAIFEQALISLGVDPGEAVYVGNNFASDVVGAHAAGLRSVWLRHPGATSIDDSVTPCVVIDSMFELASALGFDLRTGGR